MSSKHKPLKENNDGKPNHKYPNQNYSDSNYDIDLN